MCTHQKEVYNKYDGRRYYVKCGHCKACLQEKARLRALKIEDDICDQVTQELHFCTLTYSDDFVPYFDIREYNDFIRGEKDSFPVYRNDEIYTRRNRSKFGKETYVEVHRGLNIIAHIDYEFMSTNTKKYDEYDFPNPDYDSCDGFNRLHRVVNGVDTYDFYRVGVLWTPDIQNFFKKLNKRIHVHYSYYYVGEYGGQYGRPHYHIIFRTPILSEEERSTFEDAIVESWPMCDWAKHRQNAFPRSVNPASYVGSYSNRFTDIPDLFRYVKEMRPCANHSKGFGLQNPAFSLSSILEKIESRALEYSRTLNQNGVPTPTVLALPAYVINRFFPKFKGYSKMSADEIYNLLRLAKYEPRQYDECASITTSGFRIVYHKKRLHNSSYEPLFRQFMRILDVDEEQLHRILVRLYNCYLRLFTDNEKHYQEYAFLWFQAWQLYRKALHNRHYDQISDADIIVQIQFYYNIYHHLQKRHDSEMWPSIHPEYLCFSFPTLNHSPDWLIDANKFPINKYRTARSEYWYDVYRKDRKVSGFNMERYSA